VPLNEIRNPIPMKPTTKIRFTEPQIELLMRAHPNCNLDHLTELTFEFDHNGEIVDCIGAGPVEVGSLWLVGSTAFGSALGGPRLRFARSAVCVGFLPVTSRRAIAVTPVQLAVRRIRRRRLVN
jgi:hypothetical protein